MVHGCRYATILHWHARLNDRLEVSSSHKTAHFGFNCLFLHHSRNNHLYQRLRRSFHCSTRVSSFFTLKQTLPLLNSLFRDRINMNHMPSFKDTYIPFYASAGNYFIGILAGYLYHVIKRSTYQPSERTKKFLKYTFWHVFVIGVLNFYYSYIFYDYNFEKPALWIAIYTIISKNMWGYIGTFFMFCFYCKAVPSVSRFLNAKIFQTLGRITYCVYLAHFSLLRIASAEGRGAAVVRSLSMVKNLQSFMMKTF